MNNSEKSIRKNKISKKWLWTLVPIMILLPVQYLNHTGFCYSEMRYLGERELVDRFLFGDEASQMTSIEKIERAKEIKYRTGAGELDYPSCCSVKARNSLLSPESQFTNKTLIGRYLFQVNLLMPIMEVSTGRYPYEEHQSQVNSCGKRMVGDDRSIDIDEREYIAVLERNKIYWEQMGVRDE